MNIQAISFGAKQKFERTKPHVRLDKPQTNPITLQEAIKRYEQKTFASMVEQAQSALKVTSSIQNASKHFQEESRGILYDASKIQQKSEVIMAELLDTSAFNKYLRYDCDKYGSYKTQVEVKDEIFDILIGPHRIYATKTNADSKDIFVFNTKDRSLVTFVQNQKVCKQGKFADAEYHFCDNELRQCNLGISRGEFELIQKRFKYDTDRKQNSLLSISLMAKTALENESAERIFEYDDNGQMIRYLKGFREDTDYAIHSQLFYEFDDEGLIVFKKDMVEHRDYSTAKLDVEYKNENEFSIQADYDTRKDAQCSAICFYDNGLIEGSII